MTSDFHCVEHVLKFERARQKKSGFVVDEPIRILEKQVFSRPENVPTHQFVLFELFAIAERHLFFLLYSS